MKQHMSSRKRSRKVNSQTYSTDCNRKKKNHSRPKQIQRQSSKINKIIKSIFESSDEYSSDNAPIRPITSRRNKPKYQNKQKSPLHRIPKKTSTNHTNRMLPQKRRNNHNPSSSQSMQPRKKRKINHYNAKRTDNSPLKRPYRNNKTSGSKMQNKIVTEPKNKTLKNRSKPQQKLSVPTTKLIKPKNGAQPIVIDLLSDSDDNDVQTPSNCNNNMYNIQCICSAHKKYETAVSIAMIPPHIVEHELVAHFQQKYNITVLQCDPFETDRINVPFKKCSRLELLSMQQRDCVLQSSKRGELYMAITPKNTDLPPAAPKICPVYRKNDDNECLDVDRSDGEISLEMELSAMRWVNKFAVFGCDDVMPLISAMEMIDVKCSQLDGIHIDTETELQHIDQFEEKEVNIKQVSPFSIGSGNNLQFEESWSFYLCVEEAADTHSARNGDIVPMIQVIVDKTRLKLHEKCDKMIWYQRKNELATKYCEWIQNEVVAFESDVVFNEYVDLRFVSQHCGRETRELIAFRNELNKHNAVFINPNVFDGEYYIGLKVLAVIEPFGGGTIVKAQIVKVNIGSVDNMSVSHMSFSASSPSLPSTYDTFTTN